LNKLKYIFSQIIIPPQKQTQTKTKGRKRQNMAEFYKSNTHRRLISSCLNFHYFRVFLNLPSKDGVKQNIQSFLTDPITSREKISIAFHIKLLNYIHRVNGMTMKQLRTQIKILKKLKKEAERYGCLHLRKICFTRNGITNTKCCRKNLIEYMLKQHNALAIPRPYETMSLDSDLDQYIAWNRNEKEEKLLEIAKYIRYIKCFPKDFIEDVEGF